jgi:HNH endonuclease
MTRSAQGEGRSGEPALHDRGGNCGASSRPPPRDLLRQSEVEGPLRLLALRRDKYQCTMMTCTTPGRGTGGRPIVDHIIERTKGGADDLPNLRALYTTCDPDRHGDRGGGGG